MASRYQKVTDPEQVLQYYEAGLLYRLWPGLSYVENEYVPYDSIYARIGNHRDFIRGNVRSGLLYILIEDDEEQPIG